MAYRLHLAFDDPDASRSEFERNIAMGGAFIPTSDPLELRSFVEVAIELPFCDESVVLEAEVVHLIPPERALNPGDAGVAVSFRKPANELRAILEGYLEQEAAGATPSDGVPDQQEAGADDDTPVDLLMEKPGSSARSRDASTRFEVFLDGIDPSNHSDLEASVIDLAGVGLEVARMLEVIPEESGDVYRTIDVLVGRGALKIRRAGDQ